MCTKSVIKYNRIGNGKFYVFNVNKWYFCTEQNSENKINKKLYSKSGCINRLNLSNFESNWRFMQFSPGARSIWYNKWSSEKMSVLIASLGS